MDEAMTEACACGPFRSVPLRYLGYANEVGEAFKLFLPRWAYIGSYGVAVAYVLGDTQWQGRHKWELALKHPEGISPMVALSGAVVDTAMWQTAATVILPGIFVNRLVAVTASVTRRLPMLPGRLRGVLPTVVGLGSIPLIIHPIDRFVDKVMDDHVRPTIHRYQRESSKRQ